MPCRHIKRLNSQTFEALVDALSRACAASVPMPSKAPDGFVMRPRLAVVVFWLPAATAVALLLATVAGVAPLPVRAMFIKEGLDVTLPLTVPELSCGLLTQIM